MGAIQEEYNSQIEYVKRMAESDPDTYKPILSAVYDEREQAMEQLDATYSKRAKAPSVYMAPSDRAMFMLREQYYAIKDDDYDRLVAKQNLFLMKLTGQGLGQSYYDLARQADAVIDGTAAAITADPSGQEKAYKRQSQEIESLTQTALKDISAMDFVAYLESSKKTATEKETSEAQLRDGLRTLFRTSQEQWPDLFQEMPGLAARYGTNPDPVLAGNLDAQWLQYWALPGDSQERQDWIQNKQGQINEFRTGLGLGPIRPSGILPVDTASRYPQIDPVAAAIAQSQMYAEGTAE
jgi:ribosomal protein S17E